MRLGEQGDEPVKEFRPVLRLELYDWRVEIVQKVSGMGFSSSLQRRQKTSTILHTDCPAKFKLWSLSEFLPPAIDSVDNVFVDLSNLKCASLASKRIAETFKQDNLNGIF